MLIEDLDLFGIPDKFTVDIKYPDLIPASQGILSGGMVDGPYFMVRSISNVETDISRLRILDDVAGNSMDVTIFAG